MLHDVWGSRGSIAKRKHPKPCLDCSRSPAKTAKTRPKQSWWNDDQVIFWHFTAWNQRNFLLKQPKAKIRREVQARAVLGIFTEKHRSLETRRGESCSHLRRFLITSNFSPWPLREAWGARGLSSCRRHTRCSYWAFLQNQWSSVYRELAMLNHSLSHLVQQKLITRHNFWMIKTK